MPSDISIVVGDKFVETIAFTDNASQEPTAVVGVRPQSATWILQGNVSARFAAGKQFRVSGNNEPGANVVYTVSSVSVVSGNTEVVVSQASSIDVGSFMHAIDIWVVSGDKLATFTPGTLFFCVGDTAADANKAYTVQRCTYNGSSTIIYTQEDVPANTVGDGSLQVPAIHPRATASGMATRLTNEPIDLTSYTITSEIRDQQSSTGDLLATWTISKGNDPTLGILTRSLSAATTAALNFTRGWTDVKLDDGSSQPIRWPEKPVGVRLEPRPTA